MSKNLPPDTLKKVVAVLPAYRASKTLVPFLQTLPQNLFSKIILVDDSSPDRTYEIARRQKGIEVYQTPTHLGYGGNIKLCFKKALEAGADVIVEIHPDGEYLPNGIVPALKKVEEGAWLVLGNRFTQETHPLKSGMFWWKYPFIKVINSVHNLLLGTRIPDLHQGFRVYSKKLLTQINFEVNSNGYLFFFEILLQALFKGATIKSVPVGTHYRGAKRGAYLRYSVSYTLASFKLIGLFWLAKARLLRSRNFC
ncbi:MAG: glycosyltransferase family 2 protein [Candidatus Andersenbacteria bacterium]